MGWEQRSTRKCRSHQFCDEGPDPLAVYFLKARPVPPSTDEWIQKTWHIYTMEYYSAIKRNEIGSFVETWMDLGTPIQSEVSRKEKNKYHILTHISYINAYM